MTSTIIADPRWTKAYDLGESDLLCADDPLSFQQMACVPSAPMRTADETNDGFMEPSELHEMADLKLPTFDLGCAAQ